MVEYRLDVQSVEAPVAKDGKLFKFNVRSEEKADEQTGSVTTVYTYDEALFADGIADEIMEAMVAKQAKAGEKRIANEAVSKLTVTTEAGNTFDADPQARADLADGILASETTGVTSKVWRLADNSEVEIDITQLREAHLLAIEAYADAKKIGK